MDPVDFDRSLSVAIVHTGSSPGGHVTPQSTDSYSQLAASRPVLSVQSQTSPGHLAVGSTLLFISELSHVLPVCLL